jgi:hypothetical protein
MAGLALDRDVDLAVLGAGRARVLEDGADDGDGLVAIDVDVERGVERRDAEARRLARVDRLDAHDGLVD